MNRIVIRFNAIFPLSLFFFLLDKVTIAIKLQSELKSSIVNDLVISFLVDSLKMLATFLLRN